MSTPITAFYAGLLAIFFLYLTVLVIIERRRKRIGLGDEGDKHFLQMMRVHGNFAEYVPLVLVLSLIAEINHTSPIVLHVSGGLLLLGRAIHAYGLRHHYGASWQRVYGALMTFIALGTLAVANLLVLY